MLSPSELLASGSGAVAGTEAQPSEDDPPVKSGIPSQPEESVEVVAFAFGLDRKFLSTSQLGALAGADSVASRVIGVLAGSMH